MTNYLSEQGFHDPYDNLTPEMNGIFALKVMRKTEIVRLKQVDHAKNESLIHSKMRHPFVATLFHRFTDERNLNLLLEFVQCGNLCTLIRKNSRLPNEAARFFAAQVVMAMQYLHSEHVTFRDLNSDNVMLDAGCYVKLVDFGLAKVMNFDDPEARTWTLCGKPEYIAPEIITSKGHSREVDWWALGVLIHEMLAGYPPHYDQDAFVIYQKVLQTKSKALFDNMPKHFETHAKDLIKKLLTQAKANRIGSSKNGAEDIKKHKWYRGLNWAALYNKQLPPPEGLTVPTVSDATDTSNFDKYPVSTEESGPLLDADKDFANFGRWESLSKETDLKESKRP